MESTKFSGVRLKGSVLVFALLILSILLVASLSIFSSALLDRKASLSTGNSSKAFNVANSGVEDILYQIYKQNRATPNAIATAVGGSCSNGVITFDIVGGSASVTLYQDATTVLANCADADWRDKVVKIKSEGTLRASTRAVEVAVAQCKSTYAVGDNPAGIVFDAATNSIWVVNSNSNNVTKLRASDGQLLGTYAVGTSPKKAAFDPAPSGTPSIWVVNNGSNNVTKLRASDGQLLGTYAAGTNPWGITIDATTNPSSVWVTNLAAAGSVTKLRSSDGAILGTYSAHAVMPYGIAFDPSTSPNSIWVTSVGAGVSKLRASDGAFVNSYMDATSAFKYGIVFDPSTNSVWASGLGGGDSLTKFRSSNGNVIGSYDPGGTSNQGLYMAFDSLSNSVLVNTGDRIAKVDASNGNAVGSYTTINGRDDVAFDPFTDSVWVGQSASDTVTKISTACGS